MSTGNAAAMIGLANTNKIPMIGGYKQVSLTGTPRQAPTAEGPYNGMNPLVYYSRNVLGEAQGFTALSNYGAASGKTGQWVISTAGLAAGTTRVNITDGDAVANAAGTHDVLFTIPAAGVPANSWFWAMER